MQPSQEEAERPEQVDVTATYNASRSFFDGPNKNPFRKADVPVKSPESESSSDPVYRLETDEEQFRGHMERFSEIGCTDHLPDDDGEEGKESPNGYIHFDKEGNLWYRQYGQSKWERAVFHYWIRHELGQLIKGHPYVSPRGHGIMVGDETCQSVVQQAWGTERENYASIMFQYLPFERRLPTKKVGRMTYCGLVVIDFWLSPVKEYFSFPLVLSSKYEGAFMEPCQRYRREIRYEDFRARMPPIVKEMKNGEPVWRPLYGANALSARVRHFREESGNITWRSRPGSEKIRKFMDARRLGDDGHPGSIKSLPNMSRKEAADLRMVGLGSGAKKAKLTATPRSKKSYVEKVKRRAGVAIDTPMAEATNDVNIPSTNLEPSRIPSMFSGELVDSRNDVPTTAEEHLALSNALQPAADHYLQLMGFEPTRRLGLNASYYTQWTMMQHEVNLHWRGFGPAPQLVRLSKWTGGIENWSVR
ncbi:MAG: hypothetical protein ASARMPREDX12_000045 [Alectoria sarmentosa]|nr:MAG: hypothetical protein ASARMPREDX12_000045 [Alectoria sarmentosa]